MITLQSWLVSSNVNDPLRSADFWPFVTGIRTLKHTIVKPPAVPPQDSLFLLYYHLPTRWWNQKPSRGSLTLSKINSCSPLNMALPQRSDMGDNYSGFASGLACHPSRDRVHGPPATLNSPRLWFVHADLMKLLAL
ncbi:hypothetical protein MIND_00534300 [Mycena indigotica]|uniref:Uncharacterized protein n=1 Tax=Mycena indigotica TaxID=2126181 RepID=A0A8H6SXT0_9AGAR|nr:uncharacterized protein MIND_00534300 [Mycena indigotica]KAF7307401.1 hypothetical protein MIND_00534300 [Mycena indigotica]